MIITRDDVLKAIKEEPLIARYWVQPRQQGPCAVCAVGAVLRNAGLTDTQINLAAATVTQHMFASDDGSIPAELSTRNYMGALSMQWERLVDAAVPSLWMDIDAHHLEKLKPKLVQWVLENLPDGVVYDSAEDEARLAKIYSMYEESNEA